MAGGGARPAARRSARPRREPAPPVVFVHGNGDSGALWINNIWRFESNGYKRNQLFAIDFSYPSRARDDSKVQPFRSSTEDAMKELPPSWRRCRRRRAGARWR